MTTGRTGKDVGRKRPPGPIIERHYANDLTEADRERLATLINKIIRTSAGPTRHDGAELIAGGNPTVGNGTGATPIRIYMTVEHTTLNKRKASISRTFTAPAPSDLDFMGRHLHAMQQARPTLLAMAGEAFALAHANKRDTTTGTGTPASPRPAVDRRAQEAGRRNSTPPSSHGRDTDREAS